MYIASFSTVFFMINSAKLFGKNSAENLIYMVAAGVTMGRILLLLLLLLLRRLLLLLLLLLLLFIKIVLIIDIIWISFSLLNKISFFRVIVGWSFAIFSVSMGPMAGPT